MSNPRLSSPVEKLKTALRNQKPQHDTPIGLIHPYWARKPLNIVDTIIKSLSKEGDTVFDPFVGSGTIVFSAVSNNRKALASDLNPLSIFITKNVLNLAAFSEEDLKSLKFFFTDIAKKYSTWYLTENDQMIERIRYKVEGEYKNGNFKLLPVEIILKAKTKSGWRGRNSKQVSSLMLAKAASKYKSSPINFNKKKLVENSRIAIPEGALLSHFFDELNTSAINLIYDEILKAAIKENIRLALLFILSSSIPLLRLSDKKATSQWPYWRPKTIVTSRNPLFIIEKRVEALVEGANWARHQFRGNPHFKIIQSPAQEIIKRGIKEKSIDLLLTDPPYADQAPYLEYSELWNGIFLNYSHAELFTSEIVKTDAPSRKQDSRSYISRLSLAFQECCQVIKPNGYLAFFYQDRNLEHWSGIYTTLCNQGMWIIDVLPLPKQRRSLKTVTSPGRTLDGDLLVVAQKKIPATQPRKASIAKKIIIPKSKKTFFEKYSYLIHQGLVAGRIKDLAQIDADVFSLIKKLE